MDEKQLAEWLAANADKQGTDDYALMLKAFRAYSAPAETPRLSSEIVRGFTETFQKPLSYVSSIPAPDPNVPETLGSRMGNVAAQSAAMAVPLGAAATRVGQAAQGANAIRAALQNAVSNAGRSFRQAPTRFITAEAGLGAAAGYGGFVAEERYPDSDAARFVGELLGGVTASGVVEGAKRGVPAAARGVMKAARGSPLPVGMVVRTWDQIAGTANTATAMPRAQDRIRRAAGSSPLDVISSMEEELLPGARQLMTPAQLSGQPGLLSLERSIIETTDETKQRSLEQLESLNDLIRSSLTRGPSTPAAQAVEGAQRDYYTLLNERLRLAGVKTEEAIARLVPGAPAEQANRIARREIDEALEAAVKQERELFNLIEGSTPVPTASTQQAYRNLVIEMGSAGRDEIPTLARSLFGDKGRLVTGSDGVATATTTVQELRTAQSLFRAKAREARVGATPNFTQARMYDNLANAITEDISNISGEQAAIVADAVNYSRQRNEVFGRGEVGRMLRGAADSGDVIPESLTLQKTLGLGGPAGAEAYDNILEAAAFAANNANYRSFENVAVVLEDFVKNEFMRSTIRNGTVDPSLVETFVRNNEELLNRMPLLAQDIQEAAQAQTAVEASEALRRAGIQTFSDPATSKAFTLVQKGPVQAFNDVFNSTNPAVEMQKLVDIVGADATGEGLQGLKSGFFEYILSTASNSSGAVSGEALLTMLRNDSFKTAMEKLLEPAELANLGVIARTAQRVEAARRATPSKEGVTGDKLGMFAEKTLQIAGAMGGRRLSALIGGAPLQTPAFVSQLFVSLGNAGMLNPARDLIIAAMGDEKLFREVLLNNLILGKPVTRRGKQLLNSWALVSLTDRGLPLITTSEEDEE
jgi:hypothetical protein